jgi:O-antigen/teichoic acid export membrane protein
MGFFGPISSPLLDESSTPFIRRALHRARVVGSFAVVQGVVQMVGFFSGILLVRALSSTEYAYFTIANTMQGTINLLADIGISIGLISIGGRVWHDRNRFGQLINTALAVRRKLGALAILVITPVMYFLLVRNGASSGYTAILIVVILLGLIVQLSLGVLSVVPRLRSDLSRIQAIDLTGAFTRLLLIGGMLYLFMNAGVAVLIGTGVLFLQYLMFRRYVAGVVDLAAPENSDDRREIMRLTKHLAANAVFYCVQGQITIFLIGFFAHKVNSIAEVGALGRLAMIFTVVSNLLTNVFVPAFARCDSRHRLRWLFFAIVGAVTAFSAVIMAAAAWFPNQFLFILGNRYAHLQHELLLMVGAAVLNAIAGTLWGLNASKAWVAGSWLYIPLTLATQVILIPFTDFSSVAGVLTFNLFSLIPSLVLNIFLSVRGFRYFQSVTT